MTFFDSNALAASVPMRHRPQPVACAAVQGLPDNGVVVVEKPSAVLTDRFTTVTV
jgi:hypothetical protein